MKKSVIIILITLLAFACKTEQPPSKSDLDTSNLKGQVWKIDRTVHSTDGKCACPAGMRTECNETKYTYDQKGNLVESYTVDENGAINETSRYLYNRKGLCTEIVRYSGERLAGKEVPVIEGNKVTGYKVFDEKGSIESIISFNYSGDQITEEKTLDGNGEPISSVLKEYLNGQLVLETEKDSRGDVKSITRFKRNANNDILEYLVSVPKDNGEFKFTYEYEYDNAGNWIKQTKYYDGQIENIIVRNIEYYKS